MQIKATGWEPGKHQLPAPDVPMDLLCSGYCKNGPEPENYLEKQRKSAERGRG